MFRKGFQSLCKFAFRVPQKRFSSILPPPTNPAGSGAPTIPKSFNTTQILSKHLKNVRLLQFSSTRMKPPPHRIAKIPGKRLEDLGFYKPFGEFGKSIEVYSVTDTPEIEGANTPSASWVGINFPLKKDPYVRNSFKKFYTDGLRTGRLLEILDMIGGTCAYRYMKLDIMSRNATVVTICVDHFQIFEETISTDEDLFISSYVCYAGKSSIEVRVDVTYNSLPDQVLASAYYVFAAREAEDYSKAMSVPRLTFEGEDDPETCILRYEFGKLNQHQRKVAAARSTFKVAPSFEESQQLHDLFKETQKPDFTTRYTPIPDTLVEKTLLMHLQDKNVHGKTFGGYLMKEAADVAWIAAYLHGNGGYPEFHHIDDVIFLSPVEIGSVSIFRGLVTYVKENLSHVMVTVDTMKHKSDQKRTCEIHMTLCHPHELTKVIPLSYFDGMAYIEGQRRVESILIN